MREFAKGFYKSQAWKQCREAYAKSKGYLCERCLDKGIYRTGEIVHHRIHINPSNISEPSVLLDWKNLQLLCRECHAEMHKRTEKRYTVSEDGRVTAR